MATSRKVEGQGEPCERCGKPMEIREHASIGPEQLAKSYYFRRWYFCADKACKTNIVHREQFKVFNDHPVQPVGPRQARLALSEPETQSWPDTGPQDGTPPWE